MGRVMTDRVARYAALIEAEAAAVEEMAQRVTDGESLVAICKGWDVPYGRFASWVVSDPARNDVYEGALRIYTDAMAFEARDIADTTQVGERRKTTEEGTEVIEEDMLGHRKLRVETRLKLMAKWHRARYGDSLGVQHQGETVVRLTFGGERPALAGSSSVVPTAGAIEEDYV